MFWRARRVARFLGEGERENGEINGLGLNVNPQPKPKLQSPFQKFAIY